MLTTEVRCDFAVGSSRWDSSLLSLSSPHFISSLCSVPLTGPTKKLMMPYTEVTHPCHLKSIPWLWNAAGREGIWAARTGGRGVPEVGGEEGGGGMVCFTSPVSEPTSVDVAHHCPPAASNFPPFVSSLERPRGTHKKRLLVFCRLKSELLSRSAA